MPWSYTDQPEPLLTRALKAILNAGTRAGPAWLVVFASLGLSLLGIYAIDVAERAPCMAGAIGPTALRQLIYLAVGVVACVIISLPHYRSLGPWTWALYAVGLALLIFLIIPGVPSFLVRPRGGARAWIDLGPFNLQPSELVKVATVLVLAWYLRYRKNHRTLTGLLPPAILTGVPVGLIMLQPDLGTAILFIPALFFVLIAAGAKLKHLVLVVALACLAAPAAYPLLKPHQKARIVGLVQQIRGDSSEDLDINMQSVTAQRLIGAGGLAGVGDDHARALQRFNALPERHNDMVFSPVVTRFGLLGGLLTLTLFAAWCLGAFLTAATSPEPFGRLICVGAVGFLIAQVLVNIGMNLGLLPIIGITLPFVSHGGSSMIAQWAMTGLILSVGLRREGYELQRSFEWGSNED
jgi:cell division protein FtsW (lipid II flippase)